MYYTKQRSVHLFLITALLFHTATQAHNSLEKIGVLCSSSFACLKHVAYDLFSSHKDTKEHIFFVPHSIPDTYESLAEKITLHCKKNCSNAYPFLIGASTSEHQSSHRCNPEICSWSRYAEEHQLPQPQDEPAMLNMADHYKEYFRQARQMGLNSIRFSVEWALVEPQEGNFDQTELNRYADMVLEAIKHDITPVICLHHYTDPCWFIDRGGFELEENIHYFVRFSQAVYITVIEALNNDKIVAEKLLTMHPPLWATFNNPSGYAFRGYYTNDGAPSNILKRGLTWVGTVIQNMMEAHVQVYQALNQEYEGYAKNNPTLVAQKPCIGFLKNIALLDPSYKTITHALISPLSKVVISIANMIANESIFNFFRTGNFTIKIPTQVSLHHINNNAPHSLDFIGVNTYSNIHTVLSKKLIDTDPLTSTDNSTYRIYPQGLYRAISIVSRKLAKPLGIPMYITENGIATHDEAKREYFYQQYLYVLEKALHDGFDVRGYLTWTLADNYEWPTKDSTIKKSYGICSVNPDDQAQLYLKPGSYWFSDFAKAVTTA